MQFKVAPDLLIGVQELPEMGCSEESQLKLKAGHNYEIGELFSLLDLTSLRS